MTWYDYLALAVCFVGINVVNLLHARRIERTRARWVASNDELLAALKADTGDRERFIMNVYRITSGQRPVIVVETRAETAPGKAN